MQSYDFILSADGRNVPEDLSPSRLKLEPVADGFVIHNITGIRTQIVRRLDDQGYDVRKCTSPLSFGSTNCRLTKNIVGHYHVRPGHIVYINDSSIFVTPAEDPSLATPRGTRDPDVQLRVFFDIVDPTFGFQLGNMDGIDIGFRATAYTASFGADLSARVAEPPDKSPRMTQGEGLPLFRELSNQKGCSPYKHSYPDSILVVERGDCTFLDKLLEAQNAGAAGVIVISNEDLPINPTAGSDEVIAAGDLSDVGLLLLPKTTGRVLTELMETIEKVGTGQVMVAIHRDPLATADSASKGAPKKDQKREPEKDQEDRNRSGKTGEETSQDTNNPRILYINGHPLLNTRLLV